MTKATKSSIVNFCEDIFKVDLEITNREHVENFMIEEYKAFGVICGITIVSSIVTSFRSKCLFQGENDQIPSLAKIISNIPLFGKYLANYHFFGTWVMCWLDIFFKLQSPRGTQVCKARVWNLSSIQSSSVKIWIGKWNSISTCETQQLCT